MQSGAKIFLVVLWLLALSGCSPPPIDVVMNRINGKLVATLSQNWGIIFPNRKNPCVSDVIISRTEFTSDQPVWKIKIKGDVQCLKIASFTVGHTPKGFDQLVKLSADLRGDYVLTVNGTGWGKSTIVL